MDENIAQSKTVVCKINFETFYLSLKLILFLNRAYTSLKELFNILGNKIIRFFAES